MIYFIHAEAVNAVKIGVAGDVRRRLCKMQSDSPCELTVLCTLEGGEDEERELHRQFRALRLRGEWFTYGETIREYVSQFPASDVTVRWRGGAKVPAYVAPYRPPPPGKRDVLMDMYEASGFMHPLLRRELEAAGVEIAA